jgi:uncharacterized protein YtpQ (UPF0354 family)
VKTTENSDVLIVKADGNYESSVLLFDDFWKSLAPKVRGNILVAVPSRDTHLVASDQDGAAISYLKKRAKEVIGTNPYRLTDRLYVRTANGWVPFQQ